MFVRKGVCWLALDFKWVEIQILSLIEREKLNRLRGADLKQGIRSAVQKCFFVLISYMSSCCSVNWYAAEPQLKDLQHCQIYSNNGPSFGSACLSSAVKLLEHIFQFKNHHHFHRHMLQQQVNRCMAMSWDFSIHGVNYTRSVLRIYKHTRSGFKALC